VTNPQPKPSILSISDMDEFGVLTEQYGLKPQGKSAPMAASKRSTSTNGTQARSSNKGKSWGWVWVVGVVGGGSMGDFLFFSLFCSY
ncbi:unnamed protein product, partial [Prunus brigantina]